MKRSQQKRMMKVMLGIGLIELIYMWSIFWLLRVESRDFSQAEKERTACKAVQIHKMATIFT